MPTWGSRSRICRNWLGEEIKEVFGHIGAAALPGLAATLGGSQYSNYARENAVMSVSAIFEQHPDKRLDCIAALTTQLAQFSENDPTLNAYLVTALAADYKAGRINQSYPIDGKTTCSICGTRHRRNRGVR
jgi:hypothetical protein